MGTFFPFVFLCLILNLTLFSICTFFYTYPPVYNTETDERIEREEGGEKLGGGDNCKSWIGFSRCSFAYIWCYADVCYPVSSALVIFRNTSQHNLTTTSSRLSFALFLQRSERDKEKVNSFFLFLFSLLLAMALLFCMLALLTTSWVPWINLYKENERVDHAEPLLTVSQTHR